MKTQVQAKVPKLEMQVTERNDLLLARMATETGGQYWKGVPTAVAAGDRGALAVVDAIVPQDQVAFTPGAPEREFQLRWLGWLMTLVATCLSLEWLIRRVHRLA